MRIKVLVPCLDRNLDQIKELASFLHIESEAIFLNQCGKDSHDRFEMNGNEIEVISTSKRGVSMARNLLIENAKCDVGLFIDDDCVLSPGYVPSIVAAYNKFPAAEAIRFNTIRNYWNPVKAHADQERKARFRDLSSFGVWGLTFRPNVLLAKGLLFNEHLAAPNYLYNGEDSIFLFDLVKKLDHVYLATFDICEVKETKKSTWFENFDKRYFVTKGYVYTHLYGWKWRLAILRMFMKYHKDYKLKYSVIKKYAATGHFMYVHHQYEEPTNE